MNFNDRASSVDTKGMCVRLFVDWGCKGKSKVVSIPSDPRNQCNNMDLSSCGFDKKATSFNNC